MNKYQVVMGIELHIELKTNTKCFSAAANTFASLPNSKVSAIDCGYPGTLPLINEEVVISAIKLAHALKMKIANVLKFDRKNYFYPDLPKGYQITQFYHPIGANGNLEIIVDEKPFFIDIQRVHIEEDTAKQIHKDKITLLDYNRAGIPLLELVTEPIFFEAKQVITYIKTIRNILIALNISDAKMNEGSLRCDINISLKPLNSSTIGSKVEIKNLNSLNNAALAINYEIERQTKILDSNQRVNSQTRRFDEKTNTTVLLRDKTKVIDYKYFPEPNIFPIALDQAWIAEITKNLPLLPAEITKDLSKKYLLSNNEINFLIDKPQLRMLFEASVAINNLAKTTIKFLLGPVQGYLNANNIDNIDNTVLNPKNLAELIDLIDKNKVNDKQSKRILETIFNQNSSSPSELLILWDEKLVTDEDEIANFIYEIINADPEMLNQHSINPVKANKFFMGQLMKLTKGQVNPKIAQELVNKIVKEKQQIKS